MKITYNQLMSLIKEAVLEQRALSGTSPAATGPAPAPPPMGGGAPGSGPDQLHAAHGGSSRTPGGRVSSLPVFLSSYARLVLGSNPSDRSLLNLCTRIARLLSRGQEAEAVQAYAWLLGNVSRANARVRNLASGIAGLRSGPAPAGMQAAQWNEFTGDVREWTDMVRPVVTSLATALPPSLPAAGAPERAQLIATLNRAASSLRESQRKWELVVAGAETSNLADPGTSSLAERVLRLEKLYRLRNR